MAILLPPLAELETILVANHARRAGVGRALMTFLAASLKASGITEVTLEVRASNNPAAAFYRSAGFVEIGRRTRYYADPVEDAVIMRWEFA